MDDSERQGELERLITRQLLDYTAERAVDFLESLPGRPVRAEASLDELRAAFGGPLSEEGEDAVTVVRWLADAAELGVVASAGPRYFGFVIGGSLPAALAADWLTTAWDQNAGAYAVSPAGGAVEEAAARWLLELLGLPPSAGVGFVTGCQMANFTALAAARHAVLARAGWDVERRGLQGAPAVTVVLGEEAHVTVHRALRLLGLGEETAVVVAADNQGRMRAEALAEALAAVAGPTIVCAQAGNVNSGAFDPLPAIVDAARRQGAWLHVDGAFGLWARASRELAHLAVGVEGADSWATDAHKWLNVPYDCGVAIVASADDQRAAMGAAASYLIRTAGAERDALDWVPEFSRRARGFTVWAALRSLGRRGLARLVEDSCARARQFAELLSAEPGVEILNDVVLNQVLVRFLGDDPGASDALTAAVVRRVQQEGTCWLGGTLWKGRAAMRVSVSNWRTTEADVELSVAAILAALAAERGADA
jgi:glutamate/tyrosine decarboxylase-like PLP-dependent enzyme